jgi:hypothetical protein
LSTVFRQLTTSPCREIVVAFKVLPSYSFNIHFNIIIPSVPAGPRWPHTLRHRSSAARLLRLWVRIPPWAMDVCVLSGRGLCDGLITRPEESY